MQQLKHFPERLRKFPSTCPLDGTSSTIKLSDKNGQGTRTTLTCPLTKIQSSTSARIRNAYAILSKSFEALQPSFERLAHPAAPR